MIEKIEELRLKIFPTGGLGTNAYLVFSNKTKEAFLVDCPAPIGEYQNFIKDNHLDLKFIMITHGHCDHIDGLEEFLKKFPVPFYLQKNDLSMLINPLNNGSLAFGSTVSIKQKPIFCKEGDSVFLGEHRLQIIETPGHTPGSIAILVGDWLFSGDTLFYHSVGRTDFPFSNPEHLIKSIKEKIFILNPRVAVYPGHGRQTSIGEEVENNPFV
jgi:hydroxyacylglutathione hydrolase